MVLSGHCSNTDMFGRDNNYTFEGEHQRELIKYSKNECDPEGVAIIRESAPV